MNLKKRGITVGDLLLFILLIIFISVISLKFKERKDQSNLLNGLHQRAYISLKT